MKGFHNFFKNFPTIPYMWAKIFVCYLMEKYSGEYTALNTIFNLKIKV